MIENERWRWRRWRDDDEDGNDDNDGVHDNKTDTTAAFQPIHNDPTNDIKLIAYDKYIKRETVQPTSVSMAQ